MRVLSLTVAAVVFGSACSSHYMPRANGRVAIMMQDGTPVYVREGLVIQPGFLGSGLEQAVAGNPGAMAAARRFHNGGRDALIEVLIGGLAFLGGTTVLSAELASTNGLPPRATEAAGAAAIVGAVLMTYGMFQALDAQTYQWDAINIFNDGATPGPALPVAPGAWSSNDAPRATLQMR
jgi:hypothetical protein